jgi:hypothetical protein
MQRTPNSLLPFDPNADYLARPRFDSNQAAALRKSGPAGLLRLLGNKPAKRQAVQPPIFFPFD